MKTETKQELRDRIAELEAQAPLQFTKTLYVAELHRKVRRATLAAYALLATLTAIIIMEVVL